MNGMGFLKGAITGAAIGGAAMMLFDPITPRQRRRAKRQVCSAMRSISNAADDLMHMRRC